jgi:WAS family protein 1
LGRLPSYLPSVSSILLFNSDENPYKKYVTINNLEGKAGEDRQAQTTELMAAPKSLLEGTALVCHLSSIHPFTSI